MKEPRGRASRPAPDKPSIEPLVALLELTASQRPELLSVQLSVVENSPFRYALLQLVGEWGIEVQDVLKVAVKVTLQLDRLESRKDLALDPRRVARQPHLIALYHFTLERFERVPGPPRRLRRLQKIGRQLEAGLETARRRRRIEKFIGRPAKAEGAGDPEWLEKLIGR